MPKSKSLSLYSNGRPQWNLFTCQIEQCFLNISRTRYARPPDFVLNWKVFLHWYIGTVGLYIVTIVVYLCKFRRSTIEVGTYLWFELHSGSLVCCFWTLPFFVVCFYSFWWDCNCSIVPESRVINTISHKLWSFSEKTRRILIANTDARKSTISGRHANEWSEGVQILISLGMSN